MQKELARDVPKLQAKLAAFERIRQDQKRDVITAEEARRLKDTVRDMLFNALNKADVSNADFERSISSERLYPYCGVTRKAKPRGRPRKGGGGRMSDQELLDRIAQGDQAALTGTV